MKKDQIAIQLFTLREQAGADFEATMAAVAEAGYSAVEFAGFYGHDASYVRSVLQANGLRATSAHIPLSEFQNNFEQTVEDLVTIGAGWGIVPWVSPDDRSEKVLRSYAEQFNDFATRLKVAEIKFGYHNHDFEFSEQGESGKTLFEILVEASEPGSVYFQLDAFLAAVGGHDPAEVIRQHGNRIGLLHIKDGKLGATDRGLDLPFGQGDLDWAAIIGAARDINVSWYIIEQAQPNPDNPYADVTTSYNNAQRMAF